MLDEESRRYEQTARAAFAASGYGGSLVDVTEISPMVSTNHVYRLTLAHGHHLSRRRYVLARPVIERQLQLSAELREQYGQRFSERVAAAHG